MVRYELFNLMWFFIKHIKHLAPRKMLSNYSYLPLSNQLKQTSVSPLTIRSIQETEIKLQMSEVMNIYSENKPNIYRLPMYKKKMMLTGETCLYHNLPILVLDCQIQVYTTTEIFKTITLLFTGLH